VIDTFFKKEKEREAPTWIPVMGHSGCARSFTSGKCLSACAFCDFMICNKDVKMGERMSFL